MSDANFRELKDQAQALGIDLFGVCEIGNEIEDFHPEIQDVARELRYAISLGLALSREVLETIVDGPNDLYKTHYREANALLNDASFLIAKQIEARGYKAIPIAASFTVDENLQKGHLSHKQIAEMAGLGWRGRNNLLVTREYGAGVRLATILTDMPLTVGKPMDFSCNECYECVRDCPAKALGEVPEEYDFDRCYHQLVLYARRQNFGLLICGHCVKACKPMINS